MREKLYSDQALLLSSTSYAYDAANNRTRKTVDEVTTTYGYNTLNQLTGWTDTAGHSASFTYDFNGNRATRAVSGQTDSYGYDVENRLVSLSKNTAGGTGSHGYVYDYRTRRVSRTEVGTTTNLVFSGGTSVQEYTGSGTLTVDYVRGSDWGGGVGGILYSMRAGTPSFAHYDRRGDVTTRTDEAGVITYQASYEAGGRRTAEFGTTLDRQKANTKEEDPTGLLNEGFRYRDLETGTFITRDPAGLVDGPNLYTYVRQNPWSKFDPEGLQEAVVNKTRQLNDLINDGDEEAHSKVEQNTRHFQRAAGVLADGAEAVAGLNPIVSATEGITGQSAANTHKLSITERAIAVGGVASGFLKAPRWLSRLLSSGMTGKARKELLDGVRAALQSSDDAVKLEGQAARALKDDLVSFQKQIGANGSIGELDVETSKFIVEVSKSSKPGKLPQLEKLIQNPDLNPAGKGVVLYAPNITRNSQRAHEATGAAVVTTIDDLKALVLPSQP